MLYTVASALYIIKLLYNSTVSMVTDAIHIYVPLVLTSGARAFQHHPMGSAHYLTFFQLCPIIIVLLHDQYLT